MRDMTKQVDDLDPYKRRNGERPTAQVVALWLIVCGALVVFGGLFNVSINGGFADGAAASMWAWYIALLAGIAALVTGIVIKTRA